VISSSTNTTFPPCVPNATYFAFTAVATFTLSGNSWGSFLLFHCLSLLHCEHWQLQSCWWAEWLCALLWLRVACICDSSSSVHGGLQGDTASLYCPAEGKGKIHTKSCISYIQQTSKCIFYKLLFVPLRICSRRNIKKFHQQELQQYKQYKQYKHLYLLMLDVV